MDKKPFSAEAMDRVVSSESSLNLHAKNDIYGNYDINLPIDLNGNLVCRFIIERFV